MQRKEGEINMLVMASAVVALSTTDSSTMRLMLLLLVILAVILILTGSIIALVTLRKRLKVQNTQIDSGQLESKRT